MRICCVLVSLKRTYFAIMTNFGSCCAGFRCVVALRVLWVRSLEAFRLSGLRELGV